MNQQCFGLRPLVEPLLIEVDPGAGSTDAAFRVRGSAKAGCDVAPGGRGISISFARKTHCHVPLRCGWFVVTPWLNMKCFFMFFSIFWMFLCLPERCRATKSSFSFWVDNFACFRMRPSFDLWSSTYLFWQLQYISEPMEPMSLFWPIPLSACLSAK